MKKQAHTNFLLRSSLALALTPAIWSQVQARSAESAEGFVYAANERGNSISSIDLGTGHGKNIVTRDTPHDVQVSRDGRLWLAGGRSPI